MGACEGNVASSPATGVTSTRPPVRTGAHPSSPARRLAWRLMLLPSARAWPSSCQMLNNTASSILKKREGDSFMLEEKDVVLQSGTCVRAVVPVNEPVNDSFKGTFIGRLPLAERARMAKLAYGSSGACRDYVKNIREKLVALAINDSAVESFWSAVSNE